MSDALEAIARARDAVGEAEAALVAAVTDARERGHTWQEVAGVLGVTRQAVFKRFGHAADPAQHEGRPSLPTIEVPALTQAALRHLVGGDFGAFRGAMTHACARALTKRRLRTVWEQLAEVVGPFEHLDEPTSHTLDGSPAPGVVVGPAVGRAVLHHEAGEVVAHVAWNRAGRIVGATLKLRGMPETWPL